MCTDFLVLLLFVRPYFRYMAASCLFWALLLFSSVLTLMVTTLFSAVWKVVDISTQIN